MVLKSGNSLRPSHGLLLYPGVRLLGSVRGFKGRFGGYSIKCFGVMGGLAAQRPPLTHHRDWGALRAMFSIRDGK
jgi:hypothetical protein